MNMHKNARLTPRGRERIVPQVETGRTPEAVAEAAGYQLAGSLLRPRRTNVCRQSGCSVSSMRRLGKRRSSVLIAISPSRRASCAQRNNGSRRRMTGGVCRCAGCLTYQDRRKPRDHGWLSRASRRPIVLWRAECRRSHRRLRAWCGRLPAPTNRSATALRSHWGRAPDRRAAGAAGRNCGASPKARCRSD